MNRYERRALARLSKVERRRKPLSHYEQGVAAGLKLLAEVGQDEAQRIGLERLEACPETPPDVLERLRTYMGRKDKTGRQLFAE